MKFPLYPLQLAFIYLIACSCCARGNTPEHVEIIETKLGTWKLLYHDKTADTKHDGVVRFVNVKGILLKQKDTRINVPEEFEGGTLSIQNGVLILEYPFGIRLGNDHYKGASAGSSCRFGKDPGIQTFGNLITNPPK